MKVAIMQPYFLPYIGYFQLINAVDKFVIYDNIQFSKKGWINRNRILVNGKDVLVSLPLKKDSDYLNIGGRFIADSFEEDKFKILSRVKNAYQKAPEFAVVFSLFEKIVKYEEKNLFYFILNSLTILCAYMEIKTEFVISSKVPINHALKAQEKVIALCDKLKASTYVNAIGGMELYSREDFEKGNIKLSFIKSHPIEYPQFKDVFVPWLSIIDILMFNDKQTVKTYLNSYELL